MPGHVILAVEAGFGACNASPIAAQLRKAGHDVLVPGSVSQAVGLVFVNRRIEVVLINSCTEAMVGLEVAARLRAINPRIPILVVEAAPDAQSSAPESQRSICFTLAKLEQLWEWEKQEESQHSESGEFSCLPEKVTSSSYPDEDVMKG
jgi:CheY-like chemotaxis protein